MSSNRVVAVAILCATLTQLLWGGNFVAGRAIRGAIDPINLNFLRWSLASLILLPLLIHHRAPVLHTLRAAPLQVLTLSILSVTLFNMLLYSGLQTATTAEAGIIVGLSPIFILLLTHLMGDHRLGSGEIAGGALAFAGAMAVLFGRSDAAMGISGIAAPMFLLAAALVWALYTVLYQRFKLPLSPLLSMALMTTVGTVCAVPLLPLAPVPLIAIAFTAPVVLAVAYITLGASLVAFLFWQIGVQGLGPARVAPFLQLIPVFAMLLGALILNEPVGAVQIAGLSMVLAGVILAQSRRRQRPA